MAFINRLNKLGLSLLDSLGIGCVGFFMICLNACENDEAQINSLEIKQEVSQIEKTPLLSTMLRTTHRVTIETRKTYQWYCAQCHGEKGDGNGINSKYVTVPPRNHTKRDYLETRTDSELFDAIRLGGLKVGRAPCMPAWGNTLDEKMIWSLVRYIRELCNCEEI